MDITRRHLLQNVAKGAVTAIAAGSASFAAL
jgi:hypothetical protein